MLGSLTDDGAAGGWYAGTVSAGSGSDKSLSSAVGWPRATAKALGGGVGHCSEAGEAMVACRQRALGAD